MADEPTGTPEADPRDTIIANLEKKLSSFEATLGALAKQQAPAPTQPMTPQQARAWVQGADLPLPIRQNILSQGMSEADLNANSPLVMPFVNAMSGAIAAEFLGMLNTMRDDIKLIRMGRDTESYPYLDKLEDDIATLREGAQKEGRYYDPVTAYNIAYARNEKRLKQEAGETTPAGARSRDLSAQAAIPRASMRGVTAEEPRPTRTAADVASMSREERDAFFAANENTPIR
jgi:hypothetical protein